MIAARGTMRLVSQCEADSLQFDPDHRLGADIMVLFTEAGPAHAGL
jgi:hypothetical protein